MRTLLIAVTTMLLLAGCVLAMYGLSLSPLGFTIEQARGNALVSLLGLAGAALVMFALAGARGRL